MAKIPLPDVGSLGNPISAQNAINNRFDVIEAAFDNTISRDGTTPNQMEADLDLNNNDLLNVKRIDAAEIFKNGVPFAQNVAYANKLYELFDGTGAQTAFTLQIDPASLGNLYVSVDGTDLKPGIDYTYAGSTLTFTVAPAVGTKNIYVRYDRALATEDSVLRQDLGSSQTTSDKGGFLVRFFQGGIGAVIRWITDKLRERITPEDFGAAGDGVADDTVALQAAVTYAANKVLHLPRGKTYKISSAINATSPITISGYGSKITMESQLTALNITSGDVQVLGVEIVGAGNGAFNTLGRLISVKGVDGGAAVAPTYIKNVIVKDCRLHDAGRVGIYLQYVQKAEICGNDIYNIGYAGVEHVSCLDVWSHHNHIQNVTPGSAGTMYGMYASQINSADMVRHPRCERIVMSHNIVKDILWEGLDCHGGLDLVFSDNIVDNCGDDNVAIVIGHGDDEASTPIWTAENIHVVNNTISNCQDIGIATSGTTNGIIHKNIVIAGNTLENCGMVSVTSSRGGMLIQSAFNVTIANNVFDFCAPFGLVISNDDASNVAITGNTFRRIVSNALSGPRAIRINRGAGGTGPISISGNTLLRSNTGETYEAVGGVLIDASDGGNVTIGANDFSTATTPYSCTVAQVRNGATFPVTNFGQANIAVTTGVSTASQTINLPNVHSGVTLYVPHAVISGTQGGDERTVLHCTRVSTSQIKLDVFTAGGGNFAANGNVNVFWSTAGY